MDLLLTVLCLHSVSSSCCSGECQLSTSSCPRNKSRPGNDQTTMMLMPYHRPRDVDLEAAVAGYLFCEEQKIVY